MPLCLQDYVSSGNAVMVEHSLSKYTEDILQDEGVLIKFAIRSKNLKTVELLLDHFEKYQLSEVAERSYEHAQLMKKMQDAIWAAQGMYDISDEMKAKLSKYYDFDDAATHSELSEAEDISHWIGDPIEPTGSSIHPSDTAPPSAPLIGDAIVN